MPFLRASMTSEHYNSERAAAKGISSQSQQDAVEKAVLEMQHMNSILKQIQLILSGI